MVHQHWTCLCYATQCSWAIQREVVDEGRGGVAADHDRLKAFLKREDAFAAVSFVEGHARLLAGGLEAKVRSTIF